ncbi:MAG: hypothetical protein U0Z53_10120 [Blastocatellia bacterium]
MKKLVAISMLLVAVVCSAQARAATDDQTVLAQGPPPLTQGIMDRLIGMFEWALDGRFTRAQRTGFQRLCVAEWKRHDQAGMQSVLEILKAGEQLAALTDAQRRQAHDLLQNRLLATLRQQPNDESARLLLAVYERAHPANRAPDTSPESDGTGGRVPAELIGTWQTGSVSATTFVNPRTGSYSDPSGTQVRYRIFADGRYEYAALTTQSMYNCTTKLLTYKTGVVVINGSTLTFVPKNGKFTSEDNCNRQYNYEKPADLSRETFQWQVGRDETGVKICLRNARVSGCAYKR